MKFCLSVIWLGDVKYPPKMVQQKAKQVATKYIEKPVSPGLQGDDSNGYLYTYQHSPATSPSPTNSAQETLERNIERWERYRSTRQSIHPASQSSKYPLYLSLFQTFSSPLRNKVHLFLHIFPFFFSPFLGVVLKKLL